MIILSNALSEKPDEGCLKVAKNIVTGILYSEPETQLITYDRALSGTGKHLELNKLLLNKQLIQILHTGYENLLYIPFPAPVLTSMMRIWILSKFARKNLRVLMVMHHPMSSIAKWLLKKSKAEIVTLSAQAHAYYEKVIGKRAIYIKTGIDTRKFCPVDVKRKAELRKKYQVKAGKKVLLHVGHLKEGRNIRQLLKIDDAYQIFLVVSTLTADEADMKLKRELLSRPNISIIDTYVPNIEEIYQMADVYFFPVQEMGNCIDVPLSALEAAACNVPVVTTRYGELNEFEGKEGFFYIDSFEKERIRELLDLAASGLFNVRPAVMEYDWENAVSALTVWDK